MMDVTNVYREGHIKEICHYESCLFAPSPLSLKTLLGCTSRLQFASYGHSLSACLCVRALFGHTFIFECECFSALKL